MPVTLPSGRRPTMPAALHYDGKTRDWKRNADGQLIATHPNDEGMALSIFVKRGSVKSTPSIGNTLFDIEYLKQPNMAEEVRARVLDAFPLRKLVAEKKVEITGISHSETGNRLAVFVSYINLEMNDGRQSTLHEQTLEWYG